MPPSTCLPTYACNLKLRCLLKACKPELASSKVRSETLKNECTKRRVNTFAPVPYNAKGRSNALPKAPCVRMSLCRRVGRQPFRKHACRQQYVFIFSMPGTSAALANTISTYWLRAGARRSAASGRARATEWTEHGRRTVSTIVFTVLSTLPIQAQVT